jgi:hypothetical protein
MAISAEATMMRATATATPAPTGHTQENPGATVMPKLIGVPVRRRQWWIVSEGKRFQESAFSAVSASARTSRAACSSPGFARTKMRKRGFRVGGREGERL